MSNHEEPIGRESGGKAPAEMKASDFRPMRKGSSLQGFFVITMPSGIVLHDLTYHRRDDGARWVSMPARSYTATDGETRWQRLVDFTDRPTFSHFQKQALEALDRYFAKGLPGCEAQHGPAWQSRLVAEVRKPRGQASPEITDADIEF